MGLLLIRRPSDTPTVDSFDDARIVHYAIGGRRGITKGYATECNMTTSGNTLTVGAGEIIVDGWQTVIDASGEAISVGGVPTGAYISVYAEFNMTAAENPIISIKTAYDTNDYPVISNGDDLMSNPRGVARLVLWNCKKTASGVDTLTRVASIMSYGKDEIAEINRRLDELGFKQGSIELADGVLVARNDLYRLGKAVYGFIYLVSIVGQYEIVGTIPKSFASAPLKRFFSNDLYVEKDADGNTAIHAQQSLAGYISFVYVMDEPELGDDNEITVFTVDVPAGGDATTTVEYQLPFSAENTVVSALIAAQITNYGGATGEQENVTFPTNDFANSVCSAQIFGETFYSVSVDIKRDGNILKFRVKRKKQLTEPDATITVKIIITSLRANAY